MTEIKEKIRHFYYWNIKRKILYFFKIYPPYYKTLKQTLKQLKKENYYTGKGWTNLIIELTEKLIAIEKKNLPWYKRLRKRNLITIAQIKQKFGQLRYYTNGICMYADEVYNLINEYENKSWNTCEECGDVAKHTTTGWITRLCDRHMKDWIKSCGKTEEEYYKDLKEYEKNRKERMKKEK
jgi:hypothetical protein